MTGWLTSGRTGSDGGGTGSTAGRGPGLRVSGEPPSANGASSFHLMWELPGEFVGVA